MRRREFITLLGGAAAAWPLAAPAQQPRIPVVAFLIAGTPDTTMAAVTGFRKGLSQTGFIEGVNVAVELYWNYNDLDRFPTVAADLARRHVAVIAASTARAALQTKAATNSIPIVFWAAADAVQAGLVSNLARPDGNLTGINSMSAALGAKRFRLLHDLLPQAQRFGVLVQPNLPDSDSRLVSSQTAAATMGQSVDVLNVASPRDIDAAFASMIGKIDALMVLPGQLFVSRRVQLTNLTVRHILPTMFPSRAFTELGGLMSYGSSQTDEYRQVGIYVGRILKGEKPADLPVMQPTKFEFIINLQTARTIGVEVPPTLLAIADEVIE